MQRLKLSLLAIAAANTPGFNLIHPSVQGQFAEGQLMIYRLVQGLLKRIGESPVVRLDNEELVQGIHLLVSLGLLAPERIEVILYYRRPES